MTESAPARSGNLRRRLPVLAVLVVALAGGGLLDRLSAPRAPSSSESVQPGPLYAPAAALSSSWFCAGATDDSSGSLPGRVVVANQATTPVSGSVTVVGSNGRSYTSQLSVGAGSSVAVPEHVPGGSPWAGAVVDMDGGQVSAAEQTDGPYGRTVSPCASSGSSTWYLPAGETYKNADETVSLLNPYPAPTVVDLAFVTNQGIEQPQDFQAVSVGAGQLVSLDLRDHLRRRSAIALTATARSGSIVAWESQTVSAPQPGDVIVGSSAAKSSTADPVLPYQGASVTLGAPSTGTTWYWPDGQYSTGIDERYVIYNPGPHTASLRLSVGSSVGSAEPLPVTVAPYQVVDVVSALEPRIPSGQPHSAILSSVNGVPVVAVRQLMSTAGRGGVAQILGGRTPSTDWMVPDPAVDRTHGGQIVVLNPGTVPVEFSVDGQPSVKLAAAGRAAQTVTSPAPQVMTVHATGPVVVEFDVFGPAGTGVASLSLAVPAGS